VQLSGYWSTAVYLIEKKKNFKYTIIINIYICLESHKSPTNSFSYTTRQLYKHKLYNPKITQLYKIGLHFKSDPSFLILNILQNNP